MALQKVNAFFKTLYGKIFISAALGGVVLFIAAWLMMSGPAGDGTKKVDFSVPAGTGAISVTNRLYKDGLIKSRTFFRVLLRLSGNTKGIKQGYYSLNDGMTSGEIIDVITSGRSKEIRVTIPEGYNNRQIGDRFTEANFFKDRKEFLKYAELPEILKEYNIPSKTTEGYLFPSTYLVPKGYPKKKIIKMMLDEFLKETRSIEDFPEDPKKRHQLVILASIVEREAKLKEELPKIAGVFSNRITDNQPLESCATVQYLFEKPKAKLYYSDLEIKSPYNTYLNNGLPPGPIASPGLNALKATLHPSETPYRFFVVRADGSHYFSKTFAEHNMAKKNYMYK